MYFILKYTLLESGSHKKENRLNKNDTIDLYNWMICQEADNNLINNTLKYKIIFYLTNTTYEALYILYFILYCIPRKYISRAMRENYWYTAIILFICHIHQKRFDHRTSLIATD